MNRYTYSIFIVFIAVLSIVLNDYFVHNIQSLFRDKREVRDEQVTIQEDVALPAGFVETLRNNLSLSNTLTEAEQKKVLHNIPKQVNFEPKNLGVYNNIFEFSVFHEKRKSGGYLFVGDSTLSWGFSMDTFGMMAGAETHALTFGLNILDEALLTATDRIIDCYYKAPPTVLVSSSLGGLTRQERRSRKADAAIIAIALTKSCSELYDLVDKHQKAVANNRTIVRKRNESRQIKHGQKGLPGADPADPTSSGRFTPAMLINFERYRDYLEKIEPDLINLSNVHLHSIIEPQKFENEEQTHWSFYRWQPEFRLPVNQYGEYTYWVSSPDVAQKVFRTNYFQRLSHVDLSALQARHRAWTEKGACFIIPLSINPEELLRESLLESGDVCRVRFSSFVAQEPEEFRIPMQGNHHYAYYGGLSIAAIAGKMIGGITLPVWQK